MQPAHWIVMRHDTMLLSEAGGLPDTAFIAPIQTHLSSHIPVSLTDQTLIYGAICDDQKQLPAAYRFFPLRDAMERLGKPWFYLVTRAKLLLNWENNHTYCH